MDQFTQPGNHIKRVLFKEPMKMEQTECSETSAYKIQTPGNHPEESIQHSGHGESLKTRILYFTHQSIIQEPLLNSSSEKLSLPKTEHKIDP